MLQKLKLFVLDDTIYISLLIILVAFGSFALGRISISSESFAPNNKESVNTFSLKSTDFDGKISTSTLHASTTTAIIPLTSELKTAVKTTELNAVSTSKVAGDYKYVASKSGTKYHLLSCPGAKNIKDSNKIYFHTVTEAESSGYVKASNCPGL